MDYQAAVVTLAIQARRLANAAARLYELRDLRLLSSPGWASSDNPALREAQRRLMVELEAVRPSPDRTANTAEAACLLDTVVIPQLQLVSEKLKEDFDHQAHSMLDFTVRANVSAASNDVYSAPANSS